MNKSALIDKIIKVLRSELETYVRAANSSHKEATAEENRAENKYDTRGLEASYLATGQANKVMELEDTISAFEDLKAKSFDDNAIDVGALVELDKNGEKTFYFIGPNAGGTEITDGEHDVLVITPQSPLGTQLQGQQQGDRLELTLAEAKQLFQIVNVC
jgi:transcription elongation GreA/GreB family factor